MTTDSASIFDATKFRQTVQASLDAHVAAFGIEPGRHVLLRRQLADRDDIHSRRTFPGHITSSAFIMDEAGRRILLIHHRSLGRWLQPGGHYEPPDDLAQSALREAFEETGVEGLRLDSWHAASGIPVDIDSHLIPARPARDEPEHWHHDFRYIVRAAGVSGIRPDFAEVHNAEWRGLSELEAIAPQALRNLSKLGLAHL
ncbi:NUDIX hydrolase [Microvirga sp. P5_D2]